MKYSLVYVKWLDAYAKAEWCNLSDSDLHVPIEVHTVGFLIREDKESILIAGTLCEDQYGEAITIPRTWVKKKTIIRRSTR